MEQRIRFCESPDGVRVAYAMSGRGPPLVKTASWLTHLEFDWNSPVWMHWLTGLSTGMTLVRYDERGCGLSDWDVPEITFGTWVRDLEAVVDAESLERFPLIGISQGAAVAVAYAAMHPDRVSRLVLYGGYAQGRLVRDPSPRARKEAETMQRLLELGWGRENPAFRQVFATMFMPGATSEQAAWLMDLENVSATAENAVRIERASHEVDVLDLVSRVEAPALVIHARDDAMIPFEEGRKLASLLPDARFVPLDSRNHILMADEPAWPRFLRLVRDFLSVSHHATPAPDRSRLEKLTPRERQVLDAVACGLSNDEIAQRLFVSPKTVRNHITRIFRKLGVERRARAIVLARDAGLGRDAAR